MKTQEAPLSFGHLPKGEREKGSRKPEAGRQISVHVISIPEGLHVYSNGNHREYSTPRGVAQFFASWYCYTHLIPLESGKPGTTNTITTTKITTSKFKAALHLPRGSFNSGDYPGAAAITIILSLFSSIRGTVGRKSVSDFLFLIVYFLFQGKGNKEHRISLSGLMTGNVKSGSWETEPETRNLKPGTISIEGRNITVLRTFGFYWDSPATNPSVAGQVITGALHLGLQTAGTIIGETAAAPQNICRNEYSSSGKKVRSTETLKENNEYRITNNEYRITNNEYRITNNEYRITNVESGKARNQRPTCNDTRTIFLSPSPFGEGWGEAFPLRLPRGSFYSGDIPGAAAITIYHVLFSSPRVSPTQDAEFSTPHWDKCGVPNSTSRSAQPGLPVKNQQASHRSSIVPLFRGTSPDLSGRRGYLPFHRNLMFGALKQKGGTPMS